MCLGIPMQVELCTELQATCLNGDERESVDMTLVGTQPPGTWIMVFLGAARDVIDEATAMKTRDALQAVSAIMSGDTNIERWFSDLNDREPQLPPHLQQLIKTPNSESKS